MKDEVLSCCIGDSTTKLPYSGRRQALKSIVSRTAENQTGEKLRAEYTEVEVLGLK